MVTGGREGGRGGLGDYVKMPAQAHYVETEMIAVVCCDTWVLSIAHHFILG